MSDNLELVSENAAGDGYVDNVPGAVSTGYQSQNIATSAIFNGLDKSSCAVVGSNLIIYPSSIIDVNGLPFVVKTQITLALPTTGFNHYLKVVDGSTAILKEIEFTTDRGTYDTSKNGWYNGSGKRVLNWVYNIISKSLILENGNNQQSGTDDELISQISFAPINKIIPSMWGSCNYHIPILSGLTCKGLSYYEGYLYNLGDDVQKYNLDGTLDSTITVGALTNNTCATIDPTTGNLVRLSHNGGPNFITTATTYNGISSSVLSSVDIIASTATPPHSCVIDGDGNLITLRDSLGVLLIYVFSGISATITNSITPDADAKQVGYDFYNSSLLVLEMDDTAETEMPRVTRYNGNTSTVKARAALPIFYEYSGPLAFCNNPDNGECAVCFGTTIFRMGVFN